MNEKCKVKEPTQSDILNALISELPSGISCVNLDDQERVFFNWRNTEWNIEVRNMTVVNRARGSACWVAGLECELMTLLLRPRL